MQNDTHAENIEIRERLRKLEFKFWAVSIIGAILLTIISLLGWNIKSTLDLVKDSAEEAKEKVASALTIIDSGVKPLIEKFREDTREIVAVQKGELQANLLMEVQEKEWTEPELMSGWVRHSSRTNQVGFLKDINGFVHLKGVIKSGKQDVIFILPQEFRPSNKEVQIAITYPYAIGKVDIFKNGQVYAAKAHEAWLSLDGITFKAALK